MAVYQNMNQFAQTALKGSVAMNTNPTTVSVQLSPVSVATVVAGDVVALATDVARTIVVDKALVSSEAYGVVLYTPKKNSYTAGDQMEVAAAGSIVYMEAGDSITRGGLVEFYPSGSSVKAAAGTNVVVGVALDSATVGQLLRVQVKGTASLTSTFTGGTINNSAIGGTTPAAAAFTTVSASGAVTLGSTLTVARNVISTTATRTGAGAVPITVDVVKIVTTAADALTLADGVDGQTIELVMITDGGAGTLTPAHATGFSTLTFDDVGDSAVLRFLGSAWFIVGTPTATKA